LRPGLVAVGVLCALAAAAAVLLLTHALAGGGSRSLPARASIAVPPGWHTVTTASGDATLAYPPGWVGGHSDPGTVSVYLGLSRRDIPRGYLNVTPAEGDETLDGWTAFRLAHNRQEGDGQVKPISSVHGMRIGAATANCVTDVYTAEVGGRNWRELACFVQGRRASAVFIGAAGPRDWPALAPQIDTALASLVVR
jgi:hypothetical protein